MSVSIVAIWNAALSHAGHDEFVSAPTEATKAARLCALHYPDALTSLLAVHDWKFARKTAMLSLSATAAPERWVFRYALPADCVAPRALDDLKRVRPNDEALPWELEGRDLLTDWPGASLIYTQKSDVPAHYPQHFADALAWELAARVAMALTKSPKLADYARVRAANERWLAMSVDANTGQSDPEPDGEFVRGRL